MRKVHSHYENLKVSRDAPIEVIKAAYRTLSQKYHPDKNMGDEKAARVMKLLNSAYDTLSDPIKRRSHDDWISEAESVPQSDAKKTEGSGRSADAPKDENRYSAPKQNVPPQTMPSEADPFLVHVASNWIWYVIGAFGLYLVSSINSVRFDNQSNRSAPLANIAQRQYLPEGSAGKEGSASIPPTESIPQDVDKFSGPYIRPMTAPSGKPWPRAAGYVGGYESVRADGLSSVTVDNSRNDSDVFVKLVALNEDSPLPVRHFYIPAHGFFTTEKVRTGHYDIRYLDLSNGRLSRSESFRLEETVEVDGSRYDNITLTLYKVQNGNMKTYDINESEF